MILAMGSYVIQYITNFNTKCSTNIAGKLYKIAVEAFNKTHKFDDNGVMGTITFDQNGLEITGPDYHYNYKLSDIASFTRDTESTRVCIITTDIIHIFDCHLCVDMIKQSRKLFKKQKAKSKN